MRASDDGARPARCGRCGWLGAALFAAALVADTQAQPAPPPGAPPAASPFDRGRKTGAPPAASPFDRGRKTGAPPTTSPFDRGKRGRALPTCATATEVACPRRDDDAPAQVEARLTRRFLERMPSADADLGAGAATVAGVGRDDGGLFAAGATGLDTTWTVDGAPVIDPETGRLGLTVPLGFLDELAVATAGFGAARDVGVGAAVDGRLRVGGDRHAARARLWLGAGRDPTIRDRAPGEYTLVRGRYASYRTALIEATADGPIARVGGGALWYAAGLAPRLADQALVRDGFRLTDRDGDGSYDRDARGDLTHERIASHRRDALGYDVPVMARVGWRRGGHDLAATVLGEAEQVALWQVAADADAAGTVRDRYAGTASATYRGRVGASELRLQASWYRSHQTIAPRTAAGAAVAVGHANVPDDAPADAGDRALRAGCADGGDDPYPDVVNCPGPSGFYWTGGVGAIGETTIDRPRLTLDLVHRLGEHRLAAGVVGDDVRAVVATGFSGGVRRRLLGDVAIDERLVELGAGPETCDGQPCTFLARDRRTWRTRNLAAYVADTWRPASTVAVEYGVRWQSSQLGTALVVRDWLPRIGGAWDPLGAGRSRVFVGWGRYAAPVPVGLGRRLFDGPTTLTIFDANGAPFARVATAEGLPVADGARGTRADEAVAGAEVGWPDVARLGVMARSRHLGRALEDEAGVVAAAGQLGGPAATRDLDEVAVWLDGAPGAKLAARIGYAWSRLRGNWPGPIDPVEGATLGLSTLFDYGADPAMTNATGALPGDEPHRFFAELGARGRYRGLAIEGGVRATAVSGRPRSARVGTEQSFLVPRGALGRLPTQTRASVHLAARRGRWSLALDVYNLFDRRGVLAVDERYSDDGAAIAGGDAGDLVWLKTSAGQPASRNRNYGAPVRFQAPLTALLGVTVEL